MVQEIKLISQDFFQVQIFETIQPGLNISNQAYTELLKSFSNNQQTSTSQIVKENSGKIFINDQITNKLHSASITHKEKIFAIGFSRDQNFEIGIDLEVYNENKDYGFLEKHILNNFENMNHLFDYFLTVYPNISINKVILVIWTMKEAFFKLLNEKIFSPMLMTIHVNDKLSIICNQSGRTANDIRIFLADEYILSVVLIEQIKTV